MSNFLPLPTGLVAQSSHSIASANATYQPPPFKGKECSGCSLVTMGGITYSRPEGDCSNGVLIVGEALGSNEQIEGLPFRPGAQAGSVLESAFRRSGLSRNQFGLWNIVACRPPNNVLAGAPYEQSAIEHCQSHFDSVIAKYNPKCILALGATALSTLTGLKGEKLGITLTRGFIIPSIRYVRFNGKTVLKESLAASDQVFASPLPVVGSYHPSYLARGNRHLLGVLIHDIKTALTVARNGYGSIKRDYKEFPPREVAEEFLHHLKLHPELMVFGDIETVESLEGKDEDELEKVDKITQIQFEVYEGESLVMPWAYPFDDIAKQILSLSNPKQGWNWWKFDAPILKAHDVAIEGVQHDGMWSWHHWQPGLPKGLQYVTSFHCPEFGPWKHLSQSAPGFYGGNDTHSNHINHRCIMANFMRNGMMDTYNRHIVELNRVLSAVTLRGIPVNGDSLFKFGQRLAVEMDECLDQLQPLIPADLKRTHPKNGYKKLKTAIADCHSCSGSGKDEDGLTCYQCKGIGSVELVVKEFWDEIPEELKCPKCEGSGKMVKETRSKSIDKWEWVDCPTCYNITPIEGVVECSVCEGSGRIRQRVTVTRGAAKKCDVCKGKGIVSGKVEGRGVKRPCQILPFVPSSQQLLGYIKDKGYPVPINFDTKGETTEKEELKKLFKRTKDNVFAITMKYRDMEKLKGTYVDGWMPESDGRVHSEFKFSPDTGQLAATNPNVLTIPKKGDLAWEFREAIEAPPGRVIIAADYHAFHAQTLAFESRDPVYGRVAKLDVHGFLTCHLLHMPEANTMLSWSDSDILAFIKEQRASNRLYVAHGGKTFEWIRGAKSKPAILGIGFGMGEGKLYRQNEESFRDQKEASLLKGLLKELFGGIFKFQDDVVSIAYKQGFLQSRFKYLKWFWDVLHWDTNRKGMVSGDEQESAIAFLPANDAHGMFKDKILEMDKLGWLEKWQFILPYHDALYFLPLKEEAEECAASVKRIMEQPCMTLVDPISAPNGFSCEVDVQIANNLKEMK